MTKKEQALLDDLRRQLALSWPRYEKPQPFQPGPDDGKVEAWFFNSYNGLISHGWSSFLYHHRTEWPISQPSRGFSSQTSGTPYRTELEAYRAMRWEVSDILSKRLADIDAKIAELEASK